MPEYLALAAALTRLGPGDDDGGETAALLAGGLGIAATAARLLPEAAAAGAGDADERGRHRRRRHGRAVSRAGPHGRGAAVRARGEGGGFYIVRTLFEPRQPREPELRQPQDEDARVSRFRSRPQETIAGRRRRRGRRGIE